MKEKSEKAKMNPMVLTALIALVVGAVAFFGGMKYQQTRSVAFGFGGQRGIAANGARGAQGMMGNRQGFQPVAGEITANDGKTMTVKMIDGSSKLVILSDTTSVSKTSDGSKDDLSVGAKVAVFGTANSDGSVTAQNVQLNPAARMFGGTGNGGSPR